MMSLDQLPIPTPYEPAAIYSSEADCIEYVRVDAFAVYERVDSRLTLIFDDSGVTLIGFKIKGFRNAFERLKTALDLSDGQFVPLMSAIEAIYTDIGNNVLADEKVHAAYRRAYQLAANDNVRLAIAEQLSLAA